MSEFKDVTVVEKANVNFDGDSGRRAVRACPADHQQRLPTAKKRWQAVPLAG
jgi:hypothetical protein